MRSVHPADDDPIARTERSLLRRAWWFSGGFFALVGVPVVTLTILAPPTPDQVPYFAMNIGLFFAFPVAYALGIRLAIRRSMRRLEPLRSRIRDATTSVFAPMFELDTGLFVVIAGGACSVTRLFGGNCEPVPMKVQDAARWTAWPGIRRVTFIRARGRASSEVPELALLNARLGLTGSGILISAPRKPSAAPGGLRWIVTLSVYRLFSAVPTEDLVLELDAMDSIMGRTLARIQAS